MKKQSLIATVTAMALLALPLAGAALAQATVGIYSDVSGIGCTLSDKAPGLIAYYVVVRPEPGGGTTGAQFAAPKPSCFTASYVGDSAAPGMLTIGNSQTDISVGFGACLEDPAYILSINYFGLGTTPPCCAYPVVAAPNKSGIIVVDCTFAERIGTGMVSYINADQSCVCVGGGPPDLPRDPDPPSGAQRVDVNTSLSWLGTDPDGDLVDFDVYFGTSSPPPLVATVTTSSFSPPTLPFQTQHFWRVVARDATGRETSGPEWAFETRPESSTPDAPHNPFPANGAYNVPMNVAVSWVSEDADGDSLTFDLYLGTASTPPLFAAGLRGQSYQLPELLDGMRYYWQVVAKDDSSQAAGPVWWFATNGFNAPPVVPSTPQPAQDANGVSVQADLAWQCSDPEGDPITYDVYFGTTFPPVLVASDHPLKSFSLDQLAFSQRYYWRIVARDEHGAETPGPDWAFTTGTNSPPNAPGDPRPSNNGSTAAQTWLLWSATDPDGQVLTYDIYFGDTSPPPLAASGVVDKRYDPGVLQEGNAYYWRVVASDGELATSGPVWTFDVVPPVPSYWGYLGIYSDPVGVNCSLVDQAPGPVDVYVVARSFMGATGVQFAAPQPPCFTGVYLGEEVGAGFIATGNSQDGMWVSFAGCVMDAAPVVTIRYMGLGTTPDCCEYPLLPAPGSSHALLVDCNFTAGLCLVESFVFNQNATCPCQVRNPVLISRFDASATDAGVELRWELAGDETAEHYSVLRRAGETEYPQVVGEGTVAAASGSYLDTSVEPGTTYYYELLVRTADGNEFRSPVVTVTTKTVALSLGQNHPNPFNPTTVIPYTLPGGSATSRVRLVILDVSGRMVRTLVDEPQAGGLHEAVWDGRDDRGGPVSSGIYFCVLDANGQRNTRKMVLLK
jgi:hypothetical protein